jgi:hypothetical protein
MSSQLDPAYCVSPAYHPEAETRDICPLLRHQCLRERCAWYVVYRNANMCAIALLAVNSEFELSKRPGDW